MKQILSTILVAIGFGVAILLCVIGFYVVRSIVRFGGETTTDPALYADIVAEHLEWTDGYDTWGFLPRTIPKDAVKVAFFHDPGPLQATTVIALRLTLPPERVQAILKELEDSGRTEVVRDRNQFVHVGIYPKYETEKRPSEDADEYVFDLPDSFRVFRSRTGFTAVSMDTSEVFYYASMG
ncbi:MAG: hypothetical protein GY794_11485 [bacterium]|nr:hypothetical protein [bacterium]